MDDRGLPLDGCRVLLIEDEKRLARLLAEAFRRAGADTELAHDGGDGLVRARAGGHDVIVLDILLPVLSGYEVLRKLRRSGHRVPVLMLTAKDGEYDELDAWEFGADDYVVKPFSTPILIARLANLVARRSDPPLMTFGEVRLEPGRHRMWHTDREIVLGRLEYRVMTHLVSRPDRVVSKQEFLDEVWDDPSAPVNLVEVCIAGLRRKLGADLIETVRGVGYRLVARHDDSEPDAKPC
jgi:DNA-binding response OmpR family regulator